MNGEFDILGQKMERPAAAFFENLFAEEKARSGNGAGISEKEAGMVKKSAFTKEPKGISRGDPVIAIIFGISVAGYYIEPIGKSFVHFLDIIFFKNIIRIENKKSVEIISWVIFGNTV